jgi:hypothetical protein
MYSYDDLKSSLLSGLLWQGGVQHGKESH